jgi:hypothetical protein
MDRKTLRAEVDSFRVAEAGDRSVEDCFPAWYLKQVYGVSATTALQQTSDPCITGTTKGDGGLDGYHIEIESDGHLRLCLIQAKFTDSANQIAKGFKDLERSLQHVKAVIQGENTSTVENKIFVNLRRAIQTNLQADRGLLTEFELKVIHLSDLDPMVMRAHCRKAIDDLKEEFRSLFPDAQCKVELIGPSEISHTDVVRPSNDWFKLQMSVVPLNVTVGDRQVTMYSGIGKLAELVELYNLRRDDLFSKNVRYFLKGKRNEESGPSGKMRETLKGMCVSENGKTIEPELFAFLHNGVTIFARDVRIEQGSDAAQVREPFVLNGCQTIKTGFIFLCDSKIKSRIDLERWKRVKLPLRVITTRDEELIRQITVSNNRQNRMSASALHANDPEQVILAERFKRQGVFYQSQECAFTELEDTNPKLIASDYPNTNQGFVDIEDLARCLAAVAGEFDYAHSPARIFEYDAAYNRCFGQKRLRSIVFLTFLRNVHEVLSTILKKDLGLEGNGTGPKPSKLTFYAMCLLMRYIAKYRNRMSCIIMEYGGAITVRKDQLRAKIASELDGYHSGIKGQLKEKFLSLNDSRADSLKQAFQRAESALNLRASVDPFEAFQNLDEGELE